MIAGIINVEKYWSGLLNMSKISSWGETFLGIFGGCTSVSPPSHTPAGIIWASTTLNDGPRILVTFSDNFSSSSNII